MRKFVLAINPGSTSTKVSVFDNYQEVKKKNIDHTTTELEKCKNIADQFKIRKENIITWLKEEGINLSELRAVVGRGGLLRPLPGGTYMVTNKMIDDLKIGIQGEHASNLGGIIAKSIADEEEINAYIVDPVAVDEFEDIARVSGMPGIERRSLGHALNIKAVGHRISNDLGSKLEEMNFVIAHLGGGISVAPLRKGRILDYNNANEMGPFSPERAGGVPVGDIVKMCFSGNYTLSEIKKKLRGKGGLTGYLGTNDVREVNKMIESGNEKAKIVLDAMAYQISKEIGAMATVLDGNIDGIILTGGIAYDNKLMDIIKKNVEFISKVYIHPGEDEMKALNEGLLRVLENKEEAKIYEKEVQIDD